MISVINAFVKAAVANQQLLNEIEAVSKEAARSIFSTENTSELNISLRYIDSGEYILSEKIKSAIVETLEGLADEPEYKRISLSN